MRIFNLKNYLNKNWRKPVTPIEVSKAESLNKSKGKGGSATSKSNPKEKETKGRQVDYKNNWNTNTIIKKI